jgi:tetratricopeptide (TPR) repeat protein
MRKSYPNDKEMLFGLGDAEFHSANYDSAIVHFQRVLDIDAEFDRALQHLTWAYYYTDQYEEAEASAKRWVDATGTVEAYVYLATAQMANDKDEAAMRTLERAEEVDPEHSALRRQRAEFFLMGGEPKRAVSELQAVMESDTGMGSFLAGRVLAQSVYPHLGRFADAVELYRTVEELAASGTIDSSIMAQTQLGMAELHYWIYEDTAAARELLEEALALPDHYKKEMFWRSVAGVYVLLGEESRAEEILDSKIGEMPELQEQWYAVFRHSMAGRCDEAIAVIDSAIGANEVKRQGGVLYVLGRCLSHAGRYRELIEYVEPLLERQKLRFSTAFLRAPSYILLAEAHEKTGDPEVAIEYYERALAIWKDGDEVPMKVRAQSRLEALKSARSM